MVSLNKLKCVACRGGEPTLTHSEIEALSPEVSEWSVIEIGGINHLVREFRFKNFVEALDFTNRVGQIAEMENHHPMLITEWGKVSVHWWTHKISGLHKNDFIMAAKVDQLFSG